MNMTDLLASLDELTATCAQLMTTIARINAQVQAMQTPAVPAGPQKLLTAADLIDRLQISESKVYRLLANGEIPTIRMGRNVRVSEETLQAYIERMTECPEVPWYERMAS